MAATPPPPPALIDDLIEGCLIRLPPDDPANLVRAALVCKGWCRIVTDRGFASRFRELHGRPPMLGLFHVHTVYGACFTPTSSFRPRNINDYLRHGKWHAIDSRHGRVLLSSSPSLKGSLNTYRRSNLAVWNPITGDQLDLPELPLPQHPRWLSFTSKAAVLDASSSACDHLNCNQGHFLVILIDATCHWVDMTIHIILDVFVYSSQGDTWSHVTSDALGHGTMHFLPRQDVAMAENALFFKVHKGGTNGILKYDMNAHEVRWLDLPPDCCSQTRILLTIMKHGGLGILRVDKKNTVLHLWSREAGANGVFGWAPSGVIELKTLLPANSSSISTVSIVHGLGALFIMTNAGGFTVDLVSNHVRKVCGNICVNYFVPYTSFCTPALNAAFTGEGTSAGV